MSCVAFRHRYSAEQSLEQKRRSESVSKMNDDSVKLNEWLAYHYTVLPLSHLIVAIDPNSLSEDKICSLLELYKDRLYHLKI
jgi:hypothetical protein